MSESLFTELKRRNVVKVAAAYIVVSWLTLQVLDSIVPIIEAPDWVSKVVLLLLLVGFPFALIFSWAFELTPEGIKKESEVDRENSITHATSRKINFIIIAALILIIGGMIYERIFWEKQPESTEQTSNNITHSEEQSVSSLGSNNSKDLDIFAAPSIAVLPFANRSNNDDDLYFTDGIQDDILTHLAKIKALRVTSRTSVMKYRNTDKSIGVIAKELGVNAILEGAVQRAGKRIRITAQLIDTATDEHLWAETFDREMTINNLFDIQSEITKHIVLAIKGQLDPEEVIALEHKQTQSLEAWEAFSKARQLMSASGYNAEKYITALSLVENAIELDPLFLSAQLMMADVRGMLFWTREDRSELNKQQALSSLNAAIKIAPNNAQVLMAQGNYAYRFNRDFRFALNFQQRALEDNPTNVRFLELIALTQRRLGRWEEAADNLLFAAKLAPDNLSVITSTAGTLNLMGDTKRLGLFLSSTRERFPNDPDLGSIAADLALRSEGDLAKALNIHQNITPNAGQAYVSRAIDLAWLQRNQPAIIDALKQPEVITFLERFPTALEYLRGLAYHVYGNNKLAAIEFNKVISTMRGVTLSSGGLAPSFQMSNLGIAKILLGDTDTGLETAKQALDYYSYAIDKTDGAFVDQGVSYALALAGHRDESLEMIEKLLDTPGGFKRWYLYLDPRWDFFRNDERFNKLIKPLNFEQSIYYKNKVAKENQQQ